MAEQDEIIGTARVNLGKVKTILSLSPPVTTGDLDPLDLPTWLLAQLDEDERMARAAMWSGDERWRSFYRRYDDKAIVEDTYDEGVAEVRAHAADSEAVARHMARHDPARVLAEAAAKRRILDLHGRAGPSHPIEGMDPNWAYCATCGSGEADEYPADWPCETIKLLALPYADRPGYREEWRP